eukprot:8110839-Pyramimonas_sp.AAC.1
MRGITSVTLRIDLLVCITLAMSESSESPSLAARSKSSKLKYLVSTIVLCSLCCFLKTLLLVASLMIE